MPNIMKNNEKKVGFRIWNIYYFIGIWRISLTSTIVNSRSGNFSGNSTYDNYLHNFRYLGLFRKTETDRYLLVYKIQLFYIVLFNGWFYGLTYKFMFRF